MKEYLPRTMNIHAVQYDGSNYYELRDMLSELLIDGLSLIDRESPLWIGPLDEPVALKQAVEVLVTANRCWTQVHEGSWVVVWEDYVDVLSDEKFQEQYVEKS